MHSENLQSETSNIKLCTEVQRGFFVFEKGSGGVTSYLVAAVYSHLPDKVIDKILDLAAG